MPDVRRAIPTGCILRDITHKRIRITVMWGTQYSWELRVDSAEAHRRLTRALRGQKTDVRQAVSGTGPGPDDGAVSGQVGPSEFCLNFMPLRSPHDITASRQGSESELEPVASVVEIDTGISAWDRWFGGETALVGRIEAAESGCRVRGSLRPRVDIYLPLGVFLAVGLYVPFAVVLSNTWVAGALAVVIALGLAYWATAVFSSGIRSGVGILRFMDRVWRDVLVK